MKPLLIPFLVASSTAASTSAQRPPTADLVREILGDGRKPLAEARVCFHPRTRPHLRCLTETGQVLRQGKPVAARTNARGRVSLSLPASDRTDRDGAILITWPEGDEPVLGAVQIGLGTPVQVLCRPLAEIRLSAAADVHVQAVDREGQGFDLGCRTGVTALRLPEGAYRLLVVRKEGIEQHALRLRTGERVALPESPHPARRLTLPPSPDAAAPTGHWFLRHWPTTPLPVVAGKLLVPSGELPLRLVAVTATGDGSMRLLDSAWVAGAAEAIASLPAAGESRKVRILDAAGAAVPGASVFTIHQTWTDSGMGYQVRSAATSDTEGRARIRVEAGLPPETDARILVVATGFASHAAPTPTEAGAEIRMAPGQRLELSVFDPRQEPAAHLQVAFEVDASPLLASTYHTDGLGRLWRNDLAAGSVTIQLVDRRILAEPILIRLARGEVTRKVVRTRPGFSLQGQVVLPGGGRAAGAVVTLRDTTGRSRVHRTARTDAEGRFAFHGLPELARLRLSASMASADGPLISEQSWARPGDDTIWELSLKSEDPRFPGRRK